MTLLSGRPWRRVWCKKRPLARLHDQGVFHPGNGGGTLETSFFLFSHRERIEILMIMQQRIRDYLNPKATGIDPQEFALNQKIYRDARDGSIKEYDLIFENDSGKVFVTNSLYARLNR